MIAHRLSTVRDADLILVMDHGQDRRAGHARGALEQGGLYRQLHEAQIRRRRVRDEMQAALARVQRISDDELTARLRRVLEGDGGDERDGAMSGRPKIVVLGMMTKIPVAGVVWQNAPLPARASAPRLRRLLRRGARAHAVDAHAHEEDDGSALAADVHPQDAHAALRPRAALGLPRAARRRPLLRHERARARAALRVGRADRQPARRHGAAARARRHRPARLPRDRPGAAPDRAVRRPRRTTLEFLEPHVAFFTFGENYGKPGCGLPVDERFRFMPTRQPVVLDFWLGARSGPGAFTTIGNWSQPWRDVSFGGERYSLEQGPRVPEVPRPARRGRGRAFELALASYERRRIASCSRAAAGAVRARARFLARPRRLPRLHSGVARRVHRRQGAERAPAHRLVQRPQRDLSRRGPSGRDAGHRVRRCASDRRRPFPVLDGRRGRRGDRARIEADYPRARRAAVELARECFDAHRRPRPAARRRRHPDPGAIARRASLRASCDGRSRPGLASPNGACRRRRSSRSSGDRCPTREATVSGAAAATSRSSSRSPRRACFHAALPRERLALSRRRRRRARRRRQRLAGRHARVPRRSGRTRLTRARCP